MIIKWVILGIFVGFCSNLIAQPLIGLDKEEVRVIMQKQNKEFRIDKTIVRQQFNYLKYVNNIHTKTWILFFSDDDVCTKSKLICDYSEYDFILEELNEAFSREDSTSWEYSFEDISYVITLEKLEWYFVLREVMKE